MEVLIAAAVALLVGATLMGGLAQSNAHQARALKAQTAAAVAQVKVEELRAAPLSDPAWAVGTLVATPRPGYTVTTVVSQVSEALPGAGTVSWRRAAITVAWQSESYLVETAKW